MALSIGELVGYVDLDTKGAEDGLSKVTKLFGSAKSSWGKALGAAGLAAGGLFGASLAGAIGQEKYTDKLAASVGATGAESARLGKIAGDLYANAYGESVGDTSDAVASVMKNIDGMAHASSKDLEGITSSVMDVTNAFDQDLGMTTAAVGQMMRTGMAKNATQALDIITKGLQGPANKADDLLETFNEYGTEFRNLGLNGKDALGLLSQGLKGGARDADVVADSLKEFSLRTQGALEQTAANGTVSTTALGAAFMNVLPPTMDMYDAQRKLAEGGKGAKDTLGLMLEGLKKIKDPTAKANAAVQLFGTQAEDMGGALYHLDVGKAAKSIGKVGGAAKSMGKTLNDNAASNIESFKRKAQQAFINTLGGKVLPVVTDLTGDLNDKLGPAVDAVTGFLSDHSAIIKPLAAVLAGMAGGIGLVVGAMRAWAGIQAALNFLMAMNPIGIVVIAIAGLVGGLIYAYKKSETFRNIVNGAFNAVKDVAGKVFGWLPKAAAGAVDFVRNHWKTLVAILAGPLGIAVRLVTANWGKIKGATAAVWNAIKGKLSAAWSAIKGVVSAGVSAAISLIGKWAAIPGKVAGFFGRLKDAVHDKLGDVVGFVKTIPGRVLASLGNLGHLLFNAGASIIQGLIDGVTSKISALVSKLHYLTSLIPKHKGPIAKDRKLLKPAGQAIMDGLIKGLESRESKLKDKLAAITAKIGATKDAMKGVVDTVSGNFMGDAFGGDLTAFDTVLSQNTADASAFNTALQAAVKHGLSGDLLQGLSQSGNLALAQQFAAMSSKDIAAREKAYQARTAAAQGVGQFAANQLYGQQLKAQLSTQQGIRNDLREVLAELRKAQRRKHALAAQHKKSKDDTDTHHKYRTRG